MHTLSQLQRGELRGTVSLKISEHLSHFPEEIFDLADTLEVLDLSGNALMELPTDLGRLRKLRVIFCSNNPISELPAVLGDLPELEMAGFKACKISTIAPHALNPNLRWLILTDNQLTELPGEIGHCGRMEKLMLAGNRLTDLPEALGNCTNLSLLRISANKLTALPAWLLSMPRLYWLAYSGNPFCIVPTIPSPPIIDWQDLHIGQMLGEGASGLIYKAQWQTGTVNREVAVKLFKGSVTSDGLPDDEMNAFIAAGAHPGLVMLTGQVSGHPQNKKGIVMELIPERFSNLGMPPSFASCTRDVFRKGMSLSSEQVVRIAATIASVAAQLHSSGILHGDLYAHNTLIDADGNALMGDFGAAGFYDRANTMSAAAMERIEVGAFGCLLDDLLILCNDDPENGRTAMVSELRDACLAAKVSSRPVFADLEAALRGR